MSALLWLLACGGWTSSPKDPSTDDSQADDTSSIDGGGCVETGRSALALGEASPYGWSDEAVVAALSAPPEAALTWASGGTTTVAIGLSNAGAASWVTTEGEDTAIPCGDRLELGIDVTATTSDTSLDVSGDTVAMAISPSQLYLRMELDLGDVDVGLLATGDSPVIERSQLVVGWDGERWGAVEVLVTRSGTTDWERAAAF